MEEMMKLDRKSGRSISTNQPMEIMPSRKEMKAMLLPRVGDKMGVYRVIYVNIGQFRITAEGEPLPELGIHFESDGRIFEVERVTLEKKQFNAIFKGFKQNPIAEAPVEIGEDLAKVI